MVLPLVVVACVAEPIRQRCQALCNRLVFGQELSPRDAVRSLVDGFSGVGDTDELTELNRVVVHSTRACSSALWLTGPHELVLLARYPADPAAATTVPVDATGIEACRTLLGPATCWPVEYQGDLLAVLAVTAPRGVLLTRRERRLLEDLTHHAGLLVANARLTVDLARELDVVQARATELQASRREVVAAQDRRRRSLERDIHDGAQQQLVALLLMIRSLSRHRDAADLPAAPLDTIRRTLATSSETLAQLSSGRVPPVLEQAGLLAALQWAAAAVGNLGPEVDVHVALRGPLGAERDAAVYFCCLEALQNAVKHASAGRVSVSVRSDADHVELTVSDDGRGFDRSVTSGGSGLADLGSRLLLLGGTVDVVSAPGRGTTVRGLLPLSGTGLSGKPQDRTVGAPT